MSSVVLLGLLLTATACGGATEPQRTLVGSWFLSSFSDHGVVGTTTGTMTFADDGTFTTRGSVTYPGEPTDSLTLAGAYVLGAGAATVTLTTGGISGVWDLTWSGTGVTLTLQGAMPTNEIVLLAAPTLAAGRAAARR